ncbi:UTP--glucose-1-phosphate uridylyltransferase [Ostertagia ostertagi]
MVVKQPQIQDHAPAVDDVTSVDEALAIARRRDSWRPSIVASITPEITDYTSLLFSPIFVSTLENCGGSFAAGFPCTFSVYVNRKPEPYSHVVVLKAYPSMRHLWGQAVEGQEAWEKENLSAHPEVYPQRNLELAVPQYSQEMVLKQHNGHPCLGRRVQKLLGEELDAEVERMVCTRAPKNGRRQRKRRRLGALEHELAKLLNTSTAEELEKNQKELSGFRNLFARFLRAKTHVDWSKIEPLPEGTIRTYKHLNGGLGTSMGCKGPKSVIPVRNELTFLDLTLQQIQTLNKTFNVDVPLVLMNSFNTEEDTKKVLKKYANVKVSVHTFCQSQYPRINRETLMPIAKSLNDNDQEWLVSVGTLPVTEISMKPFYNSGLIDKFIADGKEYCFLSNIDNMGATVDFPILNFLLSPPAGHDHPEFLMELSGLGDSRRLMLFKNFGELERYTTKTRADVKGGTLIQYENRLTLLEIAQVPKDYVDEFKSISKFRIFNTNNLWAKLSAIKRVVENNELEMEVIVNPKHLDRGVDIIQLETAAGAAVKNFRGACGINVPRSRFLPVKKCSDLLLLMSNLYDIDHGSLTLSEHRSFPTTPLVKLGSSFDKVSDFLKRFQGIPDLLELDHLTVSGDVWFGKDVSLKGTVIIIANHGDRIDIPPGSILENKIVSGNLRILEH